jgi:hypothetical protein
MKCEHEILEPNRLSFLWGDINFLKKERNDFAKSRQQWIQAAFNIVYLECNDLFNKLVEDELCEKCKMHYSKELLIKTEI